MARCWAAVNSSTPCLPSREAAGAAPGFPAFGSGAQRHQRSRAPPGIPPPGSPPAGAAPVSYTHLDVYKRQPHDLLHIGRTHVVVVHVPLGNLQMVFPAVPLGLCFAQSYDLQSNVPAQVITADGNLLARLFDNLIGNAIKYGADGKRVLVKIWAEEETVTVSVTNYGYVIPAEELPLIFNKFYRVEQSRSSSTGGTGLGLAIAKEIVDMHGGTIAVSSDLNGTVFTVKLQIYFDINKEKFGSI